MTIPMGWEDKHFYQLLCIHRLRWCHNSVYTIDIRALSGNEHFDTRTLIKSTRYCVNISSPQWGVVRAVITSRPSGEMPLMCRPSCVHILHETYMSYRPPFSLTLVFGACIQSCFPTTDRIGGKGATPTPQFHLLWSFQYSWANAIDRILTCLFETEELGC